MAERRVAIIHAFSRANAGDGLLVDLTFEALQEAGIAREHCMLLALDPDSFADIPDVRRAPGEPAARPSLKLLDAGREAIVSAAGFGHIRSMLASAEALVAVGGGYLVADSPVRQAGVAFNHLAQLRAAASHTGPTIYLPQSIGPLRGLVGRSTRKALAGIDRIWVRDDLTLAEVGLPNMARCPDLAVMKLARSLVPSRQRRAGERPVLVARDLPNAGSYLTRLDALGKKLSNARWAVQADVTGPRSDRSFYRRIGIADDGALEQVLLEPSGPVISVRLHGAIGALLAGRPAIHLAYERKGWGAYQDLGLDEFVHDARTFDPNLVSAQAAQLAADPSPFWTRIEAAQGRLADAWRDMVRDMASRLAS